MPFHSLLDCLMPSRSRTRTRREAPRSKTCRPAVEALEDRRTPAAMLTIGDVTVLEGNAGTHNAVVPVSLTEPHSNSVTVNYNTADGSATAGSDYLAVSGKLTFAKNEMSKSILVPIRGDRIPEADRYFSVQLSNSKGGAKIADGVGLVTIVDDEPRLSINDVSALEGNSGTTPFAFTVSLSAAYDVPVTVHYTTADGSASAGVDYVAQSGTLTFEPGQPTTQTITVMVNGDQVPELNKTFVVNLSTPDSYTQIVRGTGVGTIIDASPRISISDAWQDYYGSTITFTVSLAAPSEQVVTVDFTTVDGSAVRDVNYVFQSRTLTFNPGDTVQTITVQLLTLDPADMYFSIHLSNASANALLTNEGANGYWYYDYGYYYDPGYGYYDYYYGY
jgi:large repetitive protein